MAAPLRWVGDRIGLIIRQVGYSMVKQYSVTRRSAHGQEENYTQVMAPDTHGKTPFMSTTLLPFKEGTSRQRSETLFLYISATKILYAQ